MKAICIGRNYREHALELGNSVPEQPVIFIKTEDHIHYGEDFQIPEFTQELHYECELICKINRDVPRDFSGHWTEVISEVSLGIDLTARDVQDYLKSKSLPWELSKNFRQSAVIGTFVSVTDVIGSDGELIFDFYVNREPAQHGDTRFMIFGISEIIRFSNQYFDIKKGDVLFTGTPKGVGRVYHKDEFTGILNHKKVLNVKAVELGF